MGDLHACGNLCLKTPAFSLEVFCCLFVWWWWWCGFFGLFFKWHQTEPFEKSLSLKPGKQSAGRQERACCAEAVPWQRGRWSSKEESGGQSCMLYLRGARCVWWWRFASERTRLSQCSPERIWLKSHHLESFGSSFCHISTQIRSIRKCNV